MESTIRYDLESRSGRPFLSLSVCPTSMDVRDKIAKMFLERVDIQKGSCWLKASIDINENGFHDCHITAVRPSDLESTGKEMIYLASSKFIEQRPIGKEKDLYCTEIMAIRPGTTEMCKWSGPEIWASSFEAAQDWCEQNGLGYCTVVGKVG